jgi:hypothetical protein
MMSLWAGLVVLAAAVPRFSRCDGACEIRGDTLRAAVAVGDTVRIEAADRRDRAQRRDGMESAPGWVLLVPTQPGRRTARLGSDWTIVWDAVPRRDLFVPIRAAGRSPRAIAWDQDQVERESARLLRPSGIVLKLRLVDPVRLSLEWDLDGNGKLDLWRNDEAGNSSPEEIALLRLLAERGVGFPEMVLFQDPIRIGWAVEGAPRAGDTLLRLRSSATLPWRDKSGRTVQYALEGADGERAETFSVGAYPVGGIRIQAGGVRGGLVRDHPSSDLVVRPDMPHPAFGFTETALSSPSLLFLETQGLGDPYRCARVLVRELGHALGLSDTPSPGNLMSAILHLETETPTLTPDQVVALSRRLDSVGGFRRGDLRR